jgi:hypothetical protein
VIKNSLFSNRPPHSYQLELSCVPRAMTSWYTASHQLDIGLQSKLVQHGPSFPGDQRGGQPGCNLWEKMGIIGSLCYRLEMDDEQVSVYGLSNHDPIRKTPTDFWTPCHGTYSAVINLQVFGDIENPRILWVLTHCEAAHRGPTTIYDQLVKAKILFKFQADLVLRYGLCVSFDFHSKKQFDSIWLLYVYEYSLIYAGPSV